MAQFDVHRNPAEPGRESIPYVVDIQSDLLSDLPTRLVAPLILARGFGPPVGRLHPRFVVEDSPVIMLTTEIGVLSPRALGDAVASLEDRRHEIVGAIEMLITGV
jgi:toxin CcdB